MVSLCTNSILGGTKSVQSMPVLILVTTPYMGTVVANLIFVDTLCLQLAPMPFWMAPIAPVGTSLIFGSTLLVQIVTNVFSMALMASVCTN